MIRVGIKVRAMNNKKKIVLFEPVPHHGIAFQLWSLDFVDNVLDGKRMKTEQVFQEGIIGFCGSADVDPELGIGVVESYGQLFGICRDRRSTVARSREQLQ